MKESDTVYHFSCFNHFENNTFPYFLLSFICFNNLGCVCFWGKWFPTTVNFIFQKMAFCLSKFSPLTQKWFYTLIFTSNHFRKNTEREREERAQIGEREREREREERAQIREHRSSIAPLADRRVVRSSDECARRSTSGVIDERCDRPARALVDRRRLSR